MAGLVVDLDLVLGINEGVSGSEDSFAEHELLQRWVREVELDDVLDKRDIDGLHSKLKLFIRY